MSRPLPHIVSVSVSVCVSVCVYVYVFVFVFVFVFTSCKEHQLTTDDSALITFSTDTVNFDTVFTAQGSSTRTIMIYNPNANAVRITRAWWQKGHKFFANLDGENDPSLWQDIVIYGGDSLFLFLKVEIDPYGDNRLPLETDTLFFEVNGHQQHLAVQAIGMDVERIRPTTAYTNYHFSSYKPYLLFDTLRVRDSLIIDAGATIYMHNNAAIMAYGPVRAHGDLNHPIRIMGDRTDYLFPKVPYRTASGQWGGIYLMRDSMSGTDPMQYDLAYIHLLSGQVGLWCYRDSLCCQDTLHLTNARIHNMSAYGLVLENTNAYVRNTEISNCAAFGIYLCGGRHIVEHSSIANFFGYPYTTLNIHNTTRLNVAAVYVQTAAEHMLPSVSSFYNTIITGAEHPSLFLDSLYETYPGTIQGCYLRCDSDQLVQQPWFQHNTFARDNDTVFVNTYYKYGEYIYYDFHLTERSAARFIGRPLSCLPSEALLHEDLQGHTRPADQPDAGCYTYY